MHPNKTFNLILLSRLLRRACIPLIEQDYTSLMISIYWVVLELALVWRSSRGFVLLSPLHVKLFSTRTNRLPAAKVYSIVFSSLNTLPLTASRKTSCPQRYPLHLNTAIVEFLVLSLSS